MKVYIRNGQIFILCFGVDDMYYKNKLEQFREEIMTVKEAYDDSNVCCYIVNKYIFMCYI